MALKAGYHGIKKSLLDKLLQMSGSLIIKSLGTALSLSDFGELTISAASDTAPGIVQPDGVTTFIEEGLLKSKSVGYETDLLYNSRVYTASVNLTFPEGYTIDDYKQLIIYIGGTASDGSSIPLVFDVASLKIMAPYNPTWAMANLHIFYAVYNNDSIRFTLNSDNTGFVITERTGAYTGIVRVYGIKF